MTGIRYITNEKGQKTDLIINLKEHGEIVEDLLDALTAEERRGEDTIPFEELIAQLKSEGRIND
ncbi:hypothetical protein DYBT9623_03745 [Dyadobacter sp. CECT 9623]|uniref:Uncharacterized protein n=1 Tax=Dyadobacter linearis TaxID=2823330 RepID=A0ABM8UTU6_9BACT|nr:hypothetical protein [Dyadobacter sp. CECT 9623]CAG5071754.1 hypothetical protein DYBT9623_03745 [Dyadobacter sp. CECT 9623]